MSRHRSLSNGFIEPIVSEIKHSFTVEDLKNLPHSLFWIGVAWMSFYSIKDMLAEPCTDEELEEAISVHSPNWVMWQHMSDKKIKDTLDLIIEEHDRDAINDESLEQSVMEDSKYYLQKIHEYTIPLNEESPGLRGLAMDCTQLLEIARKHYGYGK